MSEIVRVKQEIVVALAFVVLSILGIMIGESIHVAVISAVVLLVSVLFILMSISYLLDQVE
jgi:hypothetical protein